MREKERSKERDVWTAQVRASWQVYKRSNRSQLIEEGGVLEVKREKRLHHA